MGRCGSEQALGCRRVEMGCEEGDPSPLGDPPPRLDLNSNWQTSPASRGRMGWGSTGKGSVCPTEPLRWGQDRSPPQQPFQKGNAGGQWHGLGMVEQPGLGAHLVLGFRSH